MKKQLSLLLFLSLFFISSSYAQNKHEVRAAWLTTAYGLDWPKSRLSNKKGIELQKEELITILDKLYLANFNTVLFQVRTRGEVFYTSAIEPISRKVCLNDTPQYDPLEFVIQECHKRGMECHAWFVTIPLGQRNRQTITSYQNLFKKQPHLCVLYQNEYFLNPGHPQTKNYLTNLVKEVLTRYDVDGVHLDYLRYPENSPNFPDHSEYKKYGKGKSKEEWRRDNITAIVRTIYHDVKQTKPWVKVSSSPVGKYKNTSRYASKGWNSFYAVSQDVQLWLQEGIQDQIYPMMYFQGNNFYPFALNWLEKSNQRDIIPGLGIYFLDPSEGNWNIKEIKRQLFFLRKNKFSGAAHYRVEFLEKNVQGIYTFLQDKFYTHLALQPPMRWLSSEQPKSPVQLKVTNKNGFFLLNWEQHELPNESYYTYTVYASNETPVDTTNPKNILATGLRELKYLHIPHTPWERKKFYAVTAVNRYGIESKPIEQESKQHNVSQFLQD